MTLTFVVAISCLLSKSLGDAFRWDVLMSPSPQAGVVEGKNLTLTCSFTGVSDANILLVSFERKVPAGVIKAKDCKASVKSTEYSYECGEDRKTFNWTILNVRRSMHKDRWRCEMVFDNRDQLVSDRTTVNVKVPVHTVRLMHTRSASADSGVQSLQCDTGPEGSRPPASIGWWWKGLADVIETSDYTTMPVSGQSDPNLAVAVSKISLDLAQYKGRTIYCQASTAEGTVTSGDFTFNSLYYGPQNVRVSIQHYRIAEGSLAAPITCSAQCHPVCLFQWTKGDILLDSSAVLNLGNVSRNSSGTYDCHPYTAFNGSTLSGKASVYVDVQYRPEVLRISGTGEYDVNDTVTLTCDFNGNPIRSVTWTGIDNNRLLQNDSSSNGQSSRLVLPQVQCNQMGNYTCRLENSLGAVEATAIVLVRCPPFENSTVGHHGTMHGTIGEPMFLGVFVVSFRQPQFTWQQETGPPQSVIQEDSGRSSFLKITKLEHFGDFSVSVSNGIPPDTVFWFHVLPVETKHEIPLAIEVAEPQTSSLTFSRTYILVAAGCAGLFVGLLCMSVVCLMKRRPGRRCSGCCTERPYSTSQSLIREPTCQSTYLEIRPDQNQLEMSVLHGRGNDSPNTKDCDQEALYETIPNLTEQLGSGEPDYLTPGTPKQMA